MKLSEYPEGVWYRAKPCFNSYTHIVRRVGNCVFYSNRGDEPVSSLPACKWAVIERIAAVEPPNVEELQARIAELEAKLAKATRPEPAVGQVWRDEHGKQFLIMNHYGTNGGCVFAYVDGDAIEGLFSGSVGSTDTYVGIWDGVFNVKEVQSEQDD